MNTTHDAYEEEMIAMVNRNNKEADERAKAATPTQEKANTRLQVKTFGSGIKLMLLALVTVALFALTANSFLMVSTKVGWWAVLAFTAGIVLLFFAISFLYAMGLVITRKSGETR